MGPARRSSRQTSVQESEASITEEKKGKSAEKDATQWMFIVAAAALEQTGNEDNKPVICPLRHPKTEKKALFLWTHADQEIYEITQFKEEFRSWFIGNTVQANGSLYITTAVDPIFLVLPYLIAEESKSGKFMTLDQIVQDESYPECSRLTNLKGLSELHEVTEVRGDADLQAYRFDKSKTMTWLQTKTERVAELLEKKQMCISGSQSGTFIQSSRSKPPKEEYLRYAFGIISDYLPLSLAGSLRDHLALPEPVVTEKRPSEADNPPSKRVKLENMSPLEDYSEKNNVDKDNKTKVKLTQAQKKLSRTDKSGMKSISSFFSPKSKT